jgi:hypothetical protein
MFDIDTRDDVNAKSRAREKIFSPPRTPRDDFAREC